MSEPRRMAPNPHAGTGSLHSVPHDEWDACVIGHPHDCSPVEGSPPDDLAPTEAPDTAEGLLREWVRWVTAPHEDTLSALDARTRLYDRTVKLLLGEPSDAR